MDDVSNWPEAIDWMHSQARKYMDAIIELLEAEDT